MANRNNSGRQGLPELKLGAATSDNVYQANHSSDVPTGAYRALAGAAEEIAGTLGKMGAEAAQREGRVQAMADASQGVAAPQSEFTFRGASYNDTARVAMGGKLKAAILESLQGAEQTNPDSPTGFAKAVEAIRAAHKPTGFAELDLELTNFMDLQTAASFARVRDGADKVARSNMQAGFLSDLQSHQALTDQLASSAAFDDDGAARVAGGLASMMTALAKYGPRAEFTVGGQTFAADDRRLGVMTPEQMARVFIAGQSQARRTWVLSTANRLPDAESKARFVEDVQGRWAAGDPVFAGLDGADMEKLTAELAMGARRAQADEQAARTAAEGEFRDYLQAFRLNEGDPDTLREMAARTGNPGLIAQADFYATADKSVPGVLDEVYARANGYVGDAAGAIDFVINVLEGEAYVPDDNGAPSKFGMRATDGKGGRDGKPISQWTREDARAAYKREYWDAIDADNLPPAMGFVAFQAMVNTGNAQMVKRWIAETGGDVGAFLAKQSAFYEDLAAKNPAKYGDDLASWRRRVKLVAGKAAAMEGGGNADEAWESYGLDPNSPRGAAWAATQAGFRADPISFAAKKRLASIPALDVQAIFTDDQQAQAGFVQSLRQRAAVGDNLAQQYAVPRRYLSDAETVALKDRMAEDPAAGVVIARAATQALGGEGARQVMRELGREGGGLEIRLGVLATTSPTFALSAAEGLRLKAAGAKLPPLDDEDNFDVAQQAVAPAFAFVPDVLVNARQAAEAAMIADAAKGTARGVSFYMNSALGATRTGDKTYGGPAKVNGALTLLPLWLSREDAGDALAKLGVLWAERNTGPIHSNGEAMAAREIARLQLVARPNGRYWLKNPKTGAFVRAKGGQAFEPDLEQARAYLEQTMPGAVLGGRQ